MDGAMWELMSSQVVSRMELMISLISVCYIVQVMLTCILPAQRQVAFQAADLALARRNRHKQQVGSCIGLRSGTTTSSMPGTCVFSPQSTKTK